MSKKFPAAIARAKQLRSEQLFSYDKIAKTLMDEGYLTVTGLTCFGVGTVFKMIRGDFDEPSGTGVPRK